MSREVLAKLAQIDCARDILADRVRDGGPDYQLTVSAVRIVGDRALATARAQQAVGPRQADLAMVREADGWKLALTMTRSSSGWLESMTGPSGPTSTSSSSRIPP